MSRFNRIGLFLLFAISLSVSFMVFRLEALPLIKQYAEIRHLSGQRLLYREGSSRPNTATTGLKLRNVNQALIVPGNSQSWANLALVPEQSQSSSSSLVMIQAGPDELETEYTFPCEIRSGFFTIGWQRGRNRACEDEGIRLALTGAEDDQQLQASYSFLNYVSAFNTARKMFFTQSLDDEDIESFIVVKPNDSQQAIIQTRNSPENDKQAEIAVLLGTVNITFTDYPVQEEIISSGDKYRYLDNGQGQVESINLEERINSPEFQNFLNEDNWESMDSSSPSSDSILAQLRDYRSSLSLPEEMSSGPREGETCACLYPPSSEQFTGEPQRIVRGVWESRQIRFAGNQIQRFTCDVPASEFPSNQGGRRFPEEDCQQSA
ncbi:MAG: hypothetical protein ACFE0I_21520 [Elainellaceae cyanobacterium]